MPPGRVDCLTGFAVVVVAAGFFFFGVILSLARMAAFRADRTKDVPALRRLRRREGFLSKDAPDLGR